MPRTGVMNCHTRGGPERLTAVRKSAHRVIEMQVVKDVKSVPRTMLVPGFQALFFPGPPRQSPHLLSRVPVPQQP
jgi:hypothetical protein